LRRTGCASLPETIDLNLQQTHPDIAGLPGDKRHVNGFSHKKHAEEYLKGNAQFSANPYDDALTCAACHPGAKSGEAVMAEDSGKRLEAALDAAGGAKKMKNYFHATCLSCHKAMKKAKKATGPTNCKGCHGRK